MYQYEYALAQFDKAIYYLAVGEDEIRGRLLLAFQSSLWGIEPAHLPDNVRADYEWIIEQTHKYDEKYIGQKKHYESFDQGKEKFSHLLPTKLEATLYRIKRKTATKIANRIYGIWQTLQEESQNQKANNRLQGTSH